MTKPTFCGKIELSLKEEGAAMNTRYCNKSKKYYDFAPHTHADSWEISLQTAGKMEVTIGGKHYVVKENDIRVVPPGLLHEGHSAELCSDIFLVVKSLDFPDVVITHDYDGNIRKLLEIQNKVTTERGKNHEMIADAITDAIYEYIKSYQGSGYKYSFTVDFKNLIYENIANAEFNIAEEISKIGFNSDYFRKCFREDFQKSPLEYLITLRMNLAKKLLRQIPFQGVESIAHQCGFKDIYYFSKAFKKYIGCSPSEYRKSNAVQ